MAYNEPVLYSFGLYILYVLLPLVPAVLIFRLFPDSKVTVSGPLQNLTLNATGAFAAYVVTVALGFFLVKNVVTQISVSRYYPYQGVIVNVGEDQDFNSDQFYVRYDIASANGQLRTKDYSFVLLMNHPVEKPETVWVQYWKLAGPSGVGPAPAATSVPLQLVATNSFPQRFRLLVENNQAKVVPETRQ
jgi:hypothetical protein